MGAIIRPHAILEKSTGPMMKMMAENGLCLSAAKAMYLSKREADGFLISYKGVLEEYSRNVAQLSSGMCIVLTLDMPVGERETAQTVLRRLCGPHDVEIAKYIAPRSLRGVFGKD